MAGALMMNLDKSDYQKLLEENNRLTREVAELRRKLTYYENARQVVDSIAFEHEQRDNLERENLNNLPGDNPDAGVVRAWDESDAASERKLMTAKHARVEKDTAEKMRLMEEQQRLMEQRRERERREDSEREVPNMVKPFQGM